jgi:hypothetical protein
MKTNGSPPRWVKTPVADLVRYVPSGTYFARVRAGGKLILNSLRTEKVSMAQFRLQDLLSQGHGCSASVARRRSRKKT